ncbi:tyrosine-type recombinase/integrase [Desulfoplanes sp. PS50]
MSKREKFSFTAKEVEKWLRSGKFYRGEKLGGRGTGSLYLRVRGESANWEYQFFLEGRKQRMVLGTVATKVNDSSPERNHLCLVDAREKARNMARHALKGLDPRLEEERANLEEERIRKEEDLKKALDAKQSVTFSEFWESVFIHTRERLAKRTRDSNKAQFKIWIEPVIGNLKLQDLSQISLERICSNMRSKGQKPKSQKHAMGLISTMWTLAKDEGFVTGDCPTRKIKIQVENKRVRFFSRKEAELLLKSLAVVSKDTHDLSLMALRTGARFGELAKLTWIDVNLDNGIAHFKDTKNGDSRHIPFTQDIKIMLLERAPGLPWELIFPNRNGEIRDRISNTFKRIIDQLGFNENVDDSRERLTFHSLRHTCASWLVMEGVPLFKVAKLLGHTETKTTERYAHLAPDGFKDLLDIQQRIADSELIKDTEDIECNK